MLVFAPDGGVSYALIAKALLTILLSTLAARVARALHRKLHIGKGMAPIPGPECWPFLGILPLFIKNAYRFNEFHDEMMVKYGGRIKYPWSIFSDGMISIASAEDVKHVLATNMNNYVRSPRFFASMEELFGKGLLLLDHAHTKDNGAMWHLQRKVASRVFTTNNFKLFSEQIFRKHALHMVQQVKEQQGKVDMSKLASQYTLQSIFDVSCGVPLVEVDAQLGLSFVDSLSYVAHHMSTRLLSKPYFTYFWWCMPSEYRLRREAQVLTNIANTILDRRLRESAEEIEPRSDIMSLFIKKARELSLEEGSSSTSPVLDIATLRSIFLTFNWAGWDTTSSAVIYTFYALAQYPEVQEKLFQEISAGGAGALQDSDQTDGITYAGLKKFVYLDAVVSEAMRIYTTVPSTIKMAAEDDYLPDGTFIPAGVEIVYAPWYMARHNPIWGDDPLVFRPERWLEMKTRPSAYEFPIFQAGPRTCPGMNMALTEVKLLVVVLLREFQIKIQEGEQVENREYVIAPVLTMANGLPLQMTPRAGAAVARSS